MEGETFPKLLEIKVKIKDSESLVMAKQIVEFEKKMTDIQLERTICFLKGMLKERMKKKEAEKNARDKQRV